MNEISIAIDDLEVSVLLEDRKRNTWVVCLHGLQSNKAVFLDLLTKPLFQGYSSLAIDFIGFGHSSKPKDFSYDIQEQANIVEKILAQQRVDHCHIIGHSMGGMVGTMLLKQLGNKAISLVNMEGNLVAQDCGASLSIVHQSFEEFSSGGYEKFKENEAKANDQGTAKRMQWLSMIPDYAFYKAATSIVEWAKSEKLLPLFLQAPQKKLYIYGERNAAKAERLPSSIAKAKIPNAGHRMLTDNLEDTYSAIEEFYKNL